MGDIEVNLDPVVAPLLTGGGGLTMYMVLKFMDFIRRGRVESIDSLITRLYEENERAKNQAREAEQEAELRTSERDTARKSYHLEQEYAAMLLAQLRERKIEPVKRPATGR